MSIGLTNHPKHAYVAHTPTMRVPMDISSNDNVYCAMWAMLLAVRNYNQKNANCIKSVACPGMGTGTGRVPYLEAARQMALAYKNFLDPPRRIDWQLASNRDLQIQVGLNAD